MKQYFQNKNYTFVIAFVAILVAVLFYIDYHKYLGYMPWGPHFWRQSDSLAFAAHYYFHNAPFFQPGTFNAECAGGNTVSEFPILYYITALLWKIVGYKPIILKLINTTLLFAGVVYLYKSFVLLTKNYWVGIGMSLLLVSSTVLIYYTDNFVPDPPAAGLTLIGFYFFLKYTRENYFRYILYAIALFTLASLIKISLFVLPVSIAALFVLEKVFRFNLMPNRALFSNSTYKYLLVFGGYFIIVFTWVWWLKHYNEQNTCYLFLTDIKPIWKCDPAIRAHVWERLITRWYKEYYYPPVLIFITLMLVIGIVNYRRITRLGGALIIINIIGSAAFYMLFFFQFRDHDYYAIAFFVPLCVIILFITQSLFNSNMHWLRLPILLVGVFVLAGFAFTNTKLKLAKRYDSASFYPDFSKDMYTIAPYIDQIGIGPNDKVFSLPDPTPNCSLLLMRRKGFTSFHDTEGITYRDMLINYAKQGAKYLVIGDEKYYDYVNTQGIVCTPIGTYHDIRIYAYHLTE